MLRVLLKKGLLKKNIKKIEPVEHIEQAEDTKHKKYIQPNNNLVKSLNTNIKNFNLIDKANIYYINLDERTDRRNKIEQFYSKEDFFPKRFSAIKTTLPKFKKKYPKLNISKNLLKINNEKWLNGTLGCYDSHYSILQENLYNTNYKYLVVLEDDCTINTKDLNHCLNFLENNQSIDILRINCWLKIPSNPWKVNKLNSISRYYDGNNFHYFDGGTHCCIYHIKNIPNIINFMNKENVFQIDALFSNNIINSVIYKINSKIKFFSKSSIQNFGVHKDDKLYKRLLLKKLKV